AVTVAGGRTEAVGEDMAEMRSTARAAHLGALDAEAVIRKQLDRLGSYRLVLRPGHEQLVAARPAFVEPGALLVEQCARPRSLRRGLPEDRVLLRPQS